MNENYPKAYKIGYQDFYGYNFKVTKDVLIPRPETEQIIDAVLNLAGVSYLPGVKPSKNKLGQNPKILDVGTGSGCIAITLKLKLPYAEIAATDLSKNALKVAEENSKNHNTNITFYNTDLIEHINFRPDVIIANLPYVDESWDWLDKAALSHEPSEALYAKDYGLELIKKLIDQSAIKQIEYLVLEADPCQHAEVINYASQNYQLFETRGFILCMRRVRH